MSCLQVFLLDAKTQQGFSGRCTVSLLLPLTDTQASTTCVHVDTHPAFPVDR